MNKKNMRRVSMLVTAQTAKNLDRLAAMSGYYEVGRVVDKLVREKMISLRCEKEDMPHGTRYLQLIDMFGLKKGE